MTTVVNFTPAGSATISPDVIAVTYAMPAVDGGNVGLRVSNAGSGVAWLAFGSGLPVGPNVAGILTLQPGQAVLLSEIAASATTNPLVRSAQAGAYATAATVTAMTSQRGGTITLTRGTVAVGETFQ